MIRLTEVVGCWPTLSTDTRRSVRLCCKGTTTEEESPLHEAQTCDRRNQGRAPINRMAEEASTSVRAYVVYGGATKSVVLKEKKNRTVYWL